VLFVDHTEIEVSIHAASLARELGVPVVADIERAAEGLEVLLPLIDHLVVGVATAKQLTNVENVSAMMPALATGRKCVAITDGEQGCWFSEDGADVQHIPAFEVQAIDTTGCGDVFHGAYMAELAHGKSIEEALRVASAAAAITATRVGGRSGAPTRAEVVALLETGRGIT
jgi:sulfofructose kinase